MYALGGQEKRSPSQAPEYRECFGRATELSPQKVCEFARWRRGGTVFHAEEGCEHHGKRESVVGLGNLLLLSMVLCGVTGVGVRDRAAKVGRARPGRA